MWYRYSILRLSGSKADYLTSLGVAEDIIQWVESQEPDAQKFYVNAIRINPSHTIETLSGLPLPQQRSPETIYNSFELNLAQNYMSANPNFAQWLLVQLKKMRTDRKGNQYQIPKTEIQRETPLMYDWYLYSLANSVQDAQGQPRFQVASYDWNSAIKMSEEWHAMMAGKGSGLMYEPTKPENIVYDFGDGYTMQLVKSENDLLAEGNKLNHCVGGYCEAVQNGTSIIYSLRNELNHPVVTIELDSEGYVVQIQGHNNKEPDSEYDPYIEEWVSTLPKQKRIGKQDIAYNLGPIDNSELGAYLEKLVSSHDKYGLEMDVDIKSIDPQRITEDVLDKLKYPSKHSYYLETHIDDATEGLLKILTNYDKEQSEYYKKNKTRHYYYHYKEISAYYAVNEMWEDYRESYEKELLEDMKHDLPEPELQQINYRDYDDDYEYERDLRQATEEYEELHAEWKREFPDEISKHMEKWAKDDPQARLLKTLAEGLEKNYWKEIQEIRKHQE